MELNNPAARLLTILERGIKIHKKERNRDAWCKLLNVNIVNYSLDENIILMSRIGKLMSLSTDIVESLNSIDGIEVKKYLHWFEPVNRAFIGNNLNGDWQSFIGPIDNHVINYLGMTSDILSYRCPESILSESSIESILSNSRSLIDEIRGSDLPPDSKNFMVKRLHEICMAVEEYSILGTESVSKAVESTFGYGVLHKESIDLVKTNPAAKRFWQHMAKAAIIVSLAAGVQQLSPPIMKLLPEIEFQESIIQDDSIVESENSPNGSSKQDVDEAEVIIDGENGTGYRT